MATINMLTDAAPIPATAIPVFTGGDVTGPGGSAVLTIPAGTVTLAKMADVATARFFGRTTAGTGVPEALTATQATAMLNAFTSSLQGLAPASGGGTVNYLRADGTWAIPPGAGVTPAALTKVDDTNVTATLGGTPSGALLAATSITLGWTGTLAVARGGTGSGTAAGARTNLGLDAGGAGDIWVEKAGDTMTGQLLSTMAGSTANPQFLANGATNNWFAVGTAGLGAPAFTTRSLGVKYCLYPSITGATADHALGLESNFMWIGVPTTAEGIKFYGGTTLAFTFSGTGNLTAIGTVAGTNITSGGNTIGNSATATKLATARDITASGDIAWTVSFDGSGNVTAAAAINAGVIVNADVNASAAIAVSKLAAVTASRALVSDGSGFVSAATTTATEIGYVNGVTSAIQTQIDGKQPLDADLTTIAGLTATTDNFIVSVSSAWASRTPAQVKTTLALNNVDNTADAAKNVLTATKWATGRTITTTGDATGVSGAFDGSSNLSFALTIPAGTVTLAKMADIATARFIGRTTAGTGVPEALTATQATAMLNVFTSGLQGLAPASGGGSTNFLRADGTWAAPAGGSGTVTSVSVVTANGVSGSVATATTTPAITLTLGAITPTSVTASGSIAQAGGITIGSYLETNTGDLGSSTDLNPGIVVYLNSASQKNVYGMDLGYDGVAFGTRIFAPDDKSIQFSFVNAAPTAQSHFTNGAKLTTAGFAVAGTIVATGTVAGTNITAGGNTIGNSASATILATGRTIAMTGDLTWNSGSFNGSANVTAAGTLATVNSNVGTFGSATQVAQITVNAKGLTTAAANVTITPAVGSITGLGAGVATFLATPSSANLLAAVTDETGSGALVFGTTPTIATPVLNGIPTGTGVSATSTVSTLALRTANGLLAAVNMISDYTTTATAAGTTVLTVGSTYQQYFTGSTTQTVTLPVTSTLTLGHQFLIVNNSTGAVTVNSSGANLVVTLAAGTSVVVTCILTSGTTAASWFAAYSAVTVASAKKLTANNSITLAGTDATTMTFPASSTTVAGLSIAQNFTALQTITTTVTGGPGLTVSTNGSAYGILLDNTTAVNSRNIALIANDAAWGDFGIKQSNAALGNPFSAGTYLLQMTIGDVRPGTDNTQTCGTAAKRWSTVYAAVGAINTSDEREKADIGEIPDEWLDAWHAVKWRRYRFRDAVKAKGKKARWHIGAVAQAVRDAFAARKLDALAIGLVCYDEWEGNKKDGTKAGNRWGLRYDECFAMESAYLRRRLDRLEA